MIKGGDFTPNDTFFSQQWHLNNTSQTGGTVDADIDAVEGWQLTRGSSSIVVAVLDTGIDSDHPEFQGRLVPGFDFVNDDDDPEADHPHGVSVAGLLAANSDNNFAGVGVDHRVSIMPVKVLNQFNTGSLFDLAEGIIFAANQGAHVINMSIISGTPFFETLENAMQFARDAGAILVACAGNGGIGNADISSPGASPLTISVGATTSTDARASFSGTGHALDLVAPGLGLPTTTFNSTANVVSSFSGCSAATPVVAGIATLLLSIDPSLTHDDIRTILTNTAEDLVGPASEDTPSRDDFFGFGRVNMQAALQSLVGTPIGSLRCDCEAATAIVGGSGPDVLMGTAGDDIICGFGADDRLFGRGGNDCLDGGSGSDQLFEGQGNDIILGRDGIDRLLGEAGDDILRGDDGDDILNGGSGNDVLLGRTGRDMLSGGRGDDELRGGSDDDMLSGGRGNDDLHGNAGNDTLRGDADQDVLSGGRGNDTLRGDADQDDRRGGNGDDDLRGGRGNDELRGGAGLNDICNGGSGTDIAQSCASVISIP